MPASLPQQQLGALQDLAARILESRGTSGALEPLARDVLVGFFDVCRYAGLDRLLADLALDVTDRFALADHESIPGVLVDKLRTAKLDGGGPRNAKAKQVVDCLVAALDLAVIEEPDRSVSLGDDVRTKVAAALAGVIDIELAAATMREAIIADARARCAEQFHPTFAKIVAQLDDRGLHLVKQPKVPLDAMQAVQRALADAREALVDRVARAAIDAASPVLARADATVAARLDQPVTLRATPREIAIQRAIDPRVPKTPTAIAHALLDSLTALLAIKWRAPEQTAMPYAASRTFVVGNVIDHPKFGRGTVKASVAQHIDVEFADGNHRLVHVPPRR